MKKIFIFFMNMTVRCEPTQKGELNYYSKELYLGSEAWGLVCAIDEDDVSTIGVILRNNPSLVNYQEGRYGQTPLIRAIGMDKYRSCLALLEHGANPNIYDYSGYTALLESITQRWYSRTAASDIKYTELLLEYGANPNQVIGTQANDLSEVGKSPLIHCVSLGDWSKGINVVKLLIQKGADINYKTPLGWTCAIQALLMDRIEIAYYLIVELKANVKDAFYFTSTKGDSIKTDDPRYPYQLLAEMFYDLGSEEHKKKMAIVEEFKRQGVDAELYRKEIPKHRLGQIKKLYPSTWQEYLEQY